jgi:hypothetical protein
MSDHDDMPMACRRCRFEFTWTAAEQAASGYWTVWSRSRPQPPRHCPSCRTGEKRIREGLHWTQTPQGRAYFERKRALHERRGGAEVQP